MVTQHEMIIYELCLKGEGESCCVHGRDRAVSQVSQEPVPQVHSRGFSSSSTAILLMEPAVPSGFRNLTHLDPPDKAMLAPSSPSPEGQPCPECLR